MRIAPSLTWMVDSDPPAVLDPRLLPLLEAVERSGSLSAAVNDCGVSYRAAWGLLREYESRLGAPLVALERGRGARLSSAGARIVEAHRNAEHRLARTLTALGVEIDTAAKSAAHGRRHASVDKLRVAASHDLALAGLRDALSNDADIVLEITVMGSLHALQQFQEDRVDLAGFHFAIDRRETSDLASVRRFLSPRSDRLIRVVDRDQGFILRRRNPARVRSFADISRKGLRFVNRQTGSGTRMLIDRLLADERILASALLGYGNEELTHAAVAATIASGAADAGFGLRAAAAQYRLAFVPCIRERYYLAVRAAAVTTPAVARLIEILRGRTFTRVVHGLAGYRSSGAGSVIGVEALGRGAVREMR